MEEVSACRAEVKAAEKRIASFDALAKKAATVFEARLDGVGRERDQLLEQVDKAFFILLTRAPPSAVYRVYMKAVKVSAAITLC